jgi:ATP-dependent DNA ligase I
MIFSDFSFLCSSLEAVGSRLVKKDILKKFFLSHDPADVLYCIDFLTFRFSFDRIHMLLFQLDRIQVIKILSDYLGKTTDEIDKSLKYEYAGDIGSYYLAHGKENKSSFLFKEIFDSILEIGNIQGEGSQEIKKQKISTLLDKVSKQDGCYIIRLFVGAFRIGVSDKTILDVLYDILIEKNHIIAFSKDDLSYIYGIFPDLGTMGYMILSDNIDRLFELSPKIGLPILPQTAEVFFKANRLLVDFQRCEYIVQPKYDGFRLQIHIFKNGSVALFSRNQLPVAELFPSIVEVLESFAKQNNFYGILDGEIIGFDFVQNIYLPFQETAKQKRKHKSAVSSEHVILKYIIFDVLVSREEHCMKFSYIKRLEMIDQYLMVSGIERIRSIPIKNYEEIDHWQDVFIRDGYEGAMIKDTSSIYEPGKRTRTWLKYKKIQKDSLEDTIDVVILGFNLSKGAKSQRQSIGSLLVGIYDEKTDAYYSVAQVGSGGNAELWNGIYEALIELQQKEKPVSVNIHESRFPDYFVLPKIVVSVKADLVSVSTEHTSGMSLRFPRLLMMRIDKNEKETTSVEQFISKK